MPYNETAIHANIAVLVDICDGDLFKALEVARRHNTTTLYIGAKSFERELVIRMFESEWEVEQIMKLTGLAIDRIESIFDRNRERVEGFIGSEAAERLCQGIQRERLIFKKIKEVYSVGEN